ncbi:MAG TPA: hypothetical protein VH165_23050 [Kofleriaceae bacterium]|jgi:hypothetical protein|nr:hypothetical protein [Kofleriaceae bacterium]
MHRKGTGERIDPFDAFERLRLEVIGLEALANAANTTIDDYKIPPSADRRGLQRVHALVSDTAEKAKALVELADMLRESIMTRRESRQG